MSQQKQRGTRGPLAVVVVAIALTAAFATMAAEDEGSKRLSFSAHWIAAHIGDYDQQGVLTIAYTYHEARHLITDRKTTLGESTMKGFEGEPQRNWLYEVPEPYDGSGVTLSITTTHKRVYITGIIFVDGQPRATNQGRGGTQVALS